MNKNIVKLKKALTVQNIQSQSIDRIKLQDEWYDAFGEPQSTGFWFIWGNSGSGKSVFQMMLLKELSKTMNAKVAYNLLEEEPNDSDYIDRTVLLNMSEVSSNFYTVSYNLQELDYYLSSRNSPHCVVIDSLPYFTKNWDEWLQFKRKWQGRKLIIATGHAEGKNPRSEFEKSVMYDSKMKIFISGYLAICKGRTIGPNGGRFIIWNEGYNRLRGELN